MNLGKRISALASLGDALSKILAAREDVELHSTSAGMNLYRKIPDLHYSNPWFTEEYVRLSLKAISELLNIDKLRNWCLDYPGLQDENRKSKRIAVINAGNLPLVGFHDFLCVLLSGNQYYGKLSSKDNELPKLVGELLVEIEPGFSSLIEFTEDKLDSFDAVFATGSNNTARYFEYYFGKYPHIIRKNRSSIAIMDGNETAEEFAGLADDIFLYFGLGCRNVSKLYVPAGYSFNYFFECMESYNWLLAHHKYMNNHQYNRVIYLVNSDKHLDNNFLLVKKDLAISSPIAVLHFEEYENLNFLAAEVGTRMNEIQCIISHAKLPFQALPFGTAQFPGLKDYADNIDSLQFLLELGNNRTN